MKLEKQIIDRKINIMSKITLSGTDIGKDIKASKLLHDFDRVVACGASNPRDINAFQELFSVDFLKNTNILWIRILKIKNRGRPRGKMWLSSAAVIPVMTALEPPSVTEQNLSQIEMMPKAPDKRAENNPWPEWPKVCKTDYGQEEAIAVYGHDPRIYESTVKEFIKDKNGKLKAVKIVKLSWEKDPATGRMKMQEIAGASSRPWMQRSC